jgi:hypothetical protein
MDFRSTRLGLQEFADGDGGPGGLVFGEKWVVFGEDGVANAVLPHRLDEEGSLRGLPAGPLHQRRHGSLNWLAARPEAPSRRPRRRASASGVARRVRDRRMIAIFNQAFDDLPTFHPFCSRD